MLRILRFFTLAVIFASLALVDHNYLSACLLCIVGTVSYGLIMYIQGYRDAKEKQIKNINIKHIKNFPDSQRIGGGKNTLFISGNERQATVIVNSNTGEIETGQPDYSQMYLTFEAIESGTFKFSGATSAHTLSYSLDYGATWTSLAHNTDTPTINAGNTIMWKGNLTPYGSTGIGRFVATGKFDAYGNIMSLLYGDDFVGQISLTGKTYAFYGLFKGNTKIVSAQDIILPATTLAEYCYGSMFSGCKSLTTAPALPATTLAEGCYYSMFYSCTSLTTAPELPATTLASGCYRWMFVGCTSLTTAPKLPATTLAEYCYGYMFSRCTSLTTAPELPATTLADWCYYRMFFDCTSLTTDPALPATTLASFCYGSMFQGCTSLTTAPELPATTLTTYCYESMFNGCTSLITAPALPATTLASFCYCRMLEGCTNLTTTPELPATTLTNNCYYSMFYGCTSLTTAPELPATTLASSCYGYMFSGCTNLNYIKMFATDVSASGAFYDWVNGVSSTGTFVKAAGVTIPTGIDGIPSGWTVQTADV